MSWERLKTERRGCLPVKEQTETLALRFTTAYEESTIRQFYLMAPLLPELCSRMPRNGSSTHICSAWPYYFPKYFSLLLGASDIY